jgi:hypothetical protein
MVGLDEITAYTKLKREICLRVLDAIQKECGEIGNEQIEDNYISFEVYRDYFEDAPRVIRNGLFTLKLVDKFDDPFFTLIYRIQIHSKGVGVRRSMYKKGLKT